MRGGIIPELGGGFLRNQQLGDVISRIADHPNTKIDELLPWKWSGAASQAIAA